MLNVAAMTREAKVEEAIKRGVRLLPGQLRSQAEALLSPAALATMAGSIVALLIAQAFGVGEIADLLLLAAGLGFCGMGVFHGLRDLGRFAKDAVEAGSEQDLDEAARYFAAAVTELGVNAIMAILLKKPIRSFRELDGFSFRKVSPGLIAVKPPPPPGVRSTVTYADVDARYYGWADAYGDIVVNTRFSPEEQQITLDHESVHAFFSPKLGPFRQIRARLARSGYNRSPLLRYLEEAMAESYAQMRATGFKGIITGVKFPMKNGYLSAQQTQVMFGTFLGIVQVNGQMLHLSVTQAPDYASKPQPAR